MQDFVVVRCTLAGFDIAPQVEQHIVELVDRSKNTFFEDHREALTGAFGVLQVAARILPVFQEDTAPQHCDDSDAQNSGAAALRDQLWQLQQM